MNSISTNVSYDLKYINEKIMIVQIWKVLKFHIRRVFNDVTFFKIPRVLEISS